MTDAAVPLCVDLDGTLVATDTLHENLLGLIRQAPQSLPRLPGWLLEGKAAFKHRVAAAAQIDVASLPYRQDLVDWLKTQRAAGRRLVLATAADAAIAGEIAGHLGLFDEVIASDGTRNLAGAGKRQALVERFGERGFDYAGNAAPDEQVWKSARQAIVVGSGGIVERARRVAQVEQVFPLRRPGPRVWIKAARLHQWVKNALVLVPPLLAHSILQPGVLVHSLLAFLGFGMCASSVYIVNDLLDLAADRQHPRKRFRPFASGELSAGSGIAAAALLLGGAAAVALSLNLNFAAALAAYYVVTWAYSLRLKQIALLDVMTLSGLYTLRIIAGAAATAVPLSFWLLTFSMFIFLSLGIVKRYTELEAGRHAGKSASPGRGYTASDQAVLMSLGTASGYCAIVVLALYINSADSAQLYAHHKPLWLICPLMLFWISRIWIRTARDQMVDDPIVFALRDRVSLVILGLLALIVLISL